MSSHRPTLKDVAERAGVSFKTVSRVVNGEGGVTEALIERVQHAIDELGYQRNDSARALRRSGQRIGTIGIIHADISNPFAAAVHASIEQVARAHDTLLLSGSAGEDPERQEELVEAFVARQVDGLAIIPSGAPGPALSRELQRRTPIVFVDREPGVDADVILSDHRAGARAATDHLLARGHRRIGFLGSREATTSISERCAGFEQALAAVPGSSATVRTGLLSHEASEKSVRQMFTEPRQAPTALFAAQNLAAIGAVRALHGLGLQHQVALVAFDDIEAADVLNPGITTVPQNAQLLGEFAAQRLFARIAGDSGPTHRQVVPLELVERGSGEITPS